MIRPLHAAIATILLIGSFGASAEGIYKWVDAQGRTHFGASPPPGRAARSVNVPPEVATPSPGGQQTRSWQEQLELSNQRRQLARDKEQEAAKQQQDTDSRCLSARRSYDSLERGGARYRLNAQGEREYLDDAQRAAERDAAAQRIAAYCR